MQDYEGLFTDVSLPSHLQERERVNREKPCPRDTKLTDVDDVKWHLLKAVRPLADVVCQQYTHNSVPHYQDAQERLSGAKEDGDCNRQRYCHHTRGCEEDMASKADLERIYDRAQKRIDDLGKGSMIRKERRKHSASSVSLMQSLSLHSCRCKMGRPRVGLTISANTDVVTLILHWQ